MITLYTWPTPNGKKISILLEELGLPFAAKPVNIGEGEQFEPAFLAISPNNKIPAIVDTEGPDGAPISLFESGAIMIYLAGKTGQFLGETDRDRYEVLQWVMFQMGGLGPMLGQAHHFRLYAPQPIEYAIERYTKEAHRLYSVLEKRLSSQPSGFLAADCYTIADMACWPWTASHKNQGVNLEDFPHVLKWYRNIEQRPAVQRGVALFADLRKPLTDPQARALLFGQNKPA
ncbi:MAG: glutathione S-transferase family protein [Betaproteobacteria bacterium]|nr:glutathione S-transferase family protein [Betaproteobacteria bacterium]NBT74477.1 glutathione S-transferase family protein [Betaproteobacteria bacterium]NBY13779.1 glutathione S-transferase family protein [Betaproteobacteria bacterium]NCA15520.1 glutathione S-transferase family protein [Betaproteobacteria bacterium]